MARLTRLAPRLAPVAPRLNAAAEAGSAPAWWRGWYKTARWQRLRWSCLEAAGFACAMCDRAGESRELVADHVVPHRGDERLFWDAGNLQCLCTGCHASAKQRAEAGGGPKV